VPPPPTPPPTSYFRRWAALLRHEYAAGATVGLGALFAVLWSLVASGSYQRILHATWAAPVLARFDLNSTYLLTINALMTIFFFVVGLELSREIRTGVLQDRQHAALPIVAAIGGMVATALIFEMVGVAFGNSQIERGWGVPMATDIAFTLGALALVGRRVPGGLRVFLLTLAIADDVFAVVILALVSHHHAAPLWLIGAVATLVLLGWRGRRYSLAIYLLGLVVVWLFFTLAHVEPALSGAFVGVLVPFGPGSPGERIEHAVVPWSNGLVLPLFALGACGVVWDTLSTDPKVLELVGAVVCARLVGKSCGITGATAFGQRLGLKLPDDVTLPMVAASSLLCAIGFTVPLLFAGSVFGYGSVASSSITLGLLIASLLAAILGVVLLRRAINRSTVH